MSTTLDEQLITVAEAAKLLKVNPSTVWRWINQGQLPAYRVGQRRIRLKGSDLARLVTPARNAQPKGCATVDQERERLSRPLTEDQKRQALEALAAADALRQAILERRGGNPFSPSWEDLDHAREERTRQLQ